MPTKLRRSVDDKIIGGVCSGIAESLDLDPVWVRLFALLLIFANGIGVLLYIALWIIMPVSSSKIKTVKGSYKTAKGSYDNTSSIGLVLIIVGILFFANTMLNWFSFRLLWPIILIVVGVLLLISREQL